MKTCGDGFLSRWRNGDYHGTSALSENGHGGCGSGRCGPDRAGPTFGSTDLLAELFDNELYDHVTFADLIGAHRRPYVLLNAADISLGTRFEFTQEQFDFLYSDLASVPLARAVAASMTAPVFLTPVNIENHPHGADFREPAWLAATLADVDASRRRRRCGIPRSFSGY